LAITASFVLGMLTYGLLKIKSKKA